MPAEVTVTGKITVATLDSAIDINDGASIGFLTDSPEAVIIFASCKDGDICKVTGTVKGAGTDAFFTHVSRATIVSKSK